MEGGALVIPGGDGAWWYEAGGEAGEVGVAGGGADGGSGEDLLGASGVGDDPGPEAGLRAAADGEDTLDGGGDGLEAVDVVPDAEGDALEGGAVEVVAGVRQGQAGDDGDGGVGRRRCAGSTRHPDSRMGCCAPAPASVCLAHCWLR